MPSLEFSLCGAEWVAAKTQEFIEPFNAGRLPMLRFRVTAIPWADYRDELTRMAIYGRGVDVTQAGAPVANDLLAMSALRPFTEAEIASLGGPASFAPGAWDQTNRVVENRVWTLPWLVDPRGFLYWSDMLETAGVDESTAFLSFDSTLETLQRLKAAGYQTPLAISLGNENLAGQASCSWVWGAGGEFVSPDGSQALFTEPPFAAGLRAYFQLAPYLYHESGVLQIPQDTNALFLNRQSAIQFGGQWAVRSLISDPDHPLRSRLGLALPPGPPISGGSSLIIWNFSRYEEEAVKLVRYLLSNASQASYPLLVDQLPARAAVLAEPPYSTDPILRGFVRCAEAGRAFPTVRFCGLLEGLYHRAITRIWTQIATNPAADVNGLIQREIEILTRRFHGWVS